MRSKRHDGPMRFFLFAAALTVLLFSMTACGNGGMNLHPYQDSSFTPQHFSVCSGYSCYYRTPAEMTKSQWNRVLRSFKPAAKTPEKERQQIAKAMKLIEIYAGKSSGLTEDKAQAETFEKDRPTQMDCIDETINASLYLDFIHEAGVLKFHEKSPPVHRGYFIDGAWPHNSAAIREKETKEIYVVDSYYRAYGNEPYIMPLKTWAAFWRPEDDKPKEN